MYSYTWDWNWAWGWFVVVGVILGLAILVIPWFFFLLNLRNTLDRVSERNRAMPPEQVWLNFIPVFSLGWFIYTVVKVRDSVRAEYDSRGWAADGDFGYNVGLAAGILSVISLVLGWAPVIGWGLNLAWLVCWIIYWLKTNDLKNRLGLAGTSSGYTAPPPYARPGMYAGQAPTGQVPGVAGPGPWAPAAPGPPAATGTTSAQGEQLKRCGACGATIFAQDRFCRSCGLPLPRPVQVAPEQVASGPAALESAGAEPAGEEPAGPATAEDGS
jgi:hypothetical protein